MSTPERTINERIDGEITRVETRLAQLHAMIEEHHDLTERLKKLKEARTAVDQALPRPPQPAPDVRP